MNTRQQQQRPLIWRDAFGTTATLSGNASSLIGNLQHMLAHNNSANSNGSFTDSAAPHVVATAETTPAGQKIAFWFCSAMLVFYAILKILVLHVYKAGPDEEGSKTLAAATGVVTDRAILLALLYTATLGFCIEILATAAVVRE